MATDLLRQYMYYQLSLYYLRLQFKVTYLYRELNEFVQTMLIIFVRVNLVHE